MYVEKDYIMRIIQEIVRMIARLALGKNAVKEENAEVSVEVMEQYKRLLVMMEDGAINSAENLLMDYLNPQDILYFQVALEFYQKLNEKSDNFLAEHQYTRQEVLDGIRYVVNLYGYGGIMDTVLEMIYTDIDNTNTRE